MSRISGVDTQMLGLVRWRAVTELPHDLADASFEKAWNNGLRAKVEDAVKAAGSDAVTRTRAAAAVVDQEAREAGPGLAAETRLERVMASAKARFVAAGGAAT